MTRPLALVLAAGCAASPPRAAAPELQGPERFYPLAVGNAWAYDVGDEDPVLLVTRVLAREGAHATLASGNDVIAYEVAADGIRRADGTHLYRWPARAGESWPIAGGEARVAATDARERTPAGAFDGCLVVEEAAGGRRVTTAFAPGVGPVRVEVVADDGTRVAGRLRSFTRGGLE